MEYLLFIIYGFILFQIIWDKPDKAKEKSSYTPRGRSFYFRMAIINIIIGGGGLILFGYILKNKDIIPNWATWVGIIGSLIIHIQAFIYVFKAMSPNNP